MDNGQPQVLSLTRHKSQLLTRKNNSTSKLPQHKKKQTLMNVFVDKARKRIKNIVTDDKLD